jgi:ribosomal protein S12 methylthiotransferase accessory factor
MRDEVIGLVGDGCLLHDRVRVALSWEFAVAEVADTRGLSAVVSVHGDADADLRKACAETGTRLLPVRIEHGKVIIGPVTTGTDTGCPSCAAHRRRLADPRAAEREALRQRHGDAVAPSVCTSMAADAAAGLVVDEVARGRADRTFRRLDLSDLSVSRHRFLPDPACPDCGGLPADAAEPIVLRSRPKPSPDVHRVRELSTMDTELIDTYVDDAAGVVRPLLLQRDAPLVRVVAPVSSLRGTQSQNGWGRTNDVPSARLTAVLEALERAGGEKPGGRRTVVRGSYRELADRALDPRTLSLYPDDRYGSPDFRFLRYDEDLDCSWVWGHSFGRDEPVLVPERYAYYALHSPEDPRFVYEISNGCAMGGCLEEAILYGLLEVAERDAFLMTWYARMPVRRVDPFSATDRTIPLMIEHLRHRFGYDILLFCTTLEQGIPCFWGMAVDRTPGPDRPRALCAGGSAIRPEKAVLNLLHELAHLLQLVDGYDEPARERARRMVDDPHEVKIMDDHSLLYCHEDAFDRFDFLLAPRERHSFADLADLWRWPRHDDLRDDVREMIRRYRDSGLDVVVVDQTTADHRAGGFACVKVIVPGTLPMTFGHANRRVDDLPRLLTVPHRLGYRDRELTLADLNPHPHPFP